MRAPKFVASWSKVNVVEGPPKLAASIWNEGSLEEEDYGFSL